MPAAPTQREGGAAGAPKLAACSFHAPRARATAAVVVVGSGTGELRIIRHSTDEPMTSLIVRRHAAAEKAPS